MKAVVVVLVLLPIAVIANAADRTERCDVRCGNGFCVPHSCRCNGVQDCNDGVDEVGCQVVLDEAQIEYERALLEYERQMAEYKIKLAEWRRRYGGQQAEETQQPRCNGETDWKCDNLECISETQLCDGVAHCSDGSDETADLC